MTNSPDVVLIAGAGPTGLVLALWLDKLGVRVRIIDKAPEPATTTRALSVLPRTLELYEQLDLVSEIIDQGCSVSGANAWVKGRRVFHVPLIKAAEAQTAYPFIHLASQDEHEKILTKRLQTRGISIERDTELTGYIDDAENGCVVATLRKADGSEEICRARYLAGCDGAHSAVRRNSGIEFPGGTYEQTFYVADIAASGKAMDGEMHICIDQADFLAIFPLNREGGHARLIGSIRQSDISEDLSFENVGKRAAEKMALNVTQVNWFSTYRIHHRVADHFRKGRCFLLGDAAHVHSPAGGQGMNTGIGDAINLAWKLAAVTHGEAHDSLLDTYEEERRSFAKVLVATTDRVFSFATAKGWFARFIRIRIFPLIMPWISSFQFARNFMFKRLSQIMLNYGGMALSSGRVGRVSGGDRLPWIQTDEDGVSNYQSLSSMKWQIHIYGEGSESLDEWCKQNQLAIHVFNWNAKYASMGLKRNVIYLLRPDSYIALVTKTVDHVAVEEYFKERNIRVGSV